MESPAEVNVKPPIRTAIFSSSNGPEDPLTHRCPSLPAQIVNLILAATGSANFYVLIPTGPSYSQLVGEPASFSGILLALFPLASVISSFFYDAALSRDASAPQGRLACAVSFRGLLVAILVLNTFANVIYAMVIASATHLSLSWGASLLIVSRILLGLGLTNSISITWISLSFGPGKIQAASAHFSMAIMLGVSVGGFLAGILSTPPSLVLWDMIYLTKDTMPGWCFAFLSLLNIALLLVWFEEPTMPAPLEGDVCSEAEAGGCEEATTDGSHCHAESLHRSMSATTSSSNESKNMDKGGKRGIVSSLRLPTVALIALYINVAHKFALAAFESSAPLVTSALFRWSVMEVSLLLSTLASLVFPAFYLHAHYLTLTPPDRPWLYQKENRLIVGMLLLNITGTVLLFQYGNYDSEGKEGERASSQIDVLVAKGLYCFGGLVFLIGNTLLYGVVQVLIIKHFPKDFAGGAFKSGFIIFAGLSMGRMLGAIYGTRFVSLGSYEQENVVMGPILGLYFVSLGLVIAFYKVFD